MSRFILSAFADEIDADLAAQMNTLEGHGVKFIEMRAVNNKNITQHSIPEAREIKKQLDARGFAVSSLGSPIGKVRLSETFGEHLDLFKHTVEIARTLETKYMRIFSFYGQPGEDPANYRSEVLERLKKLVEISSGSGITLLHENEKHIYGDIAERCLDILINIPEIKAVFDPANFMQCGVNSLKAFESLEPYVDYMHIKDFSHETGMVVPAGKGDGGLPDILKRLYTRGFDGFLSLEPHLKRISEQENPYMKKGAGGPEQMAAAINALKSVLGDLGIAY